MNCKNDNFLSHFYGQLYVVHQLPISDFEQDAGCWVLGAGCWMLGAGGSMLDGASLEYSWISPAEPIPTSDFDVRRKVV